ncbi:hypothetical protein [Bacillus velezensis]|uniref:hypothetical protein n=1 Tax=Bacillus velezensis TaxID=492670 RepID=UPI0018E8E7AF|nr:hypothetical protein [Bacillus velezensis]
MGYGDKELITFQKRRLRNSILIMLAAVPPSLLINKLWFFSAIPAFLYIWYSSYAKAKREYKAFRFNKQILFSRFMRLVMPYLKEKHNTNYGVFKRLHKRLDEKSELKNLLKL